MLEFLIFIAGFITCILIQIFNDKYQDFLEDKEERHGDR